MKEQVVLQIRMFAEPSAAYVASERPGSVVNVHVGFEISGSGEGFTAQRTFVWFLLNMRHSVVIQVGTRCESFSAHLTLVRFFSGMNPSMCVEGTARAKAFIANGTHVRFFSCVSSHVSFQKGRTVEGFSTDFAG